MIKIALAGNPNCGKTTLFNALTGANQYVGNWPGVTVEKKEGKLKKHDDVTIVDLPGIYSLSPYTIEEVISRSFLVNDRPDAILNIIDGTNIERNLYLTTQVLELGIPVVVAVNMIDILEKRGDKLDAALLSKQLGCPVLKISALKEIGLDELSTTVIRTAEEKNVTIPRHIFSGAVEHAIAHIEEAVIHDMALEKQRWYAVKLFERDQMIADELKITDEVLSHVEDDIKAAEAELDDDAESIITNERYVYITEILKSSYRKKQTSGLSVSDKIDRIVTNRFLALPIFALVMMGVYYISITTIGTLFTDFVNDCIFGEGFDLFGHHIQSIPGFAEGLLEKIGVATWLQSLIVDGIIGGVGAVLGFLPQMMVLFILLGFLEGSGYMARIAFMLDKIFRRFGLSGKSFIPMLVATGCGVPGIMASRTIENERDRKMTIITTTFMPCGAKLPIIALISATLFNNAWWITTLSYFIGIVAIVLSGLILKRTKLFAGDVSPFVMELPDYHFPKVRNVLYSMWERAWSFAKNAGTIILLSSVIIWALSHFSFGESGFGFSLDLELEDSILGLIGKMFAWIFAPLGFNSIKATIATIMGLVAKEEVVAVFGVLDFEIMSRLAAFSFLVFNLLCAPCFAAIGAIKREMNDKKWTIFAVAYQTIFAYCASLLIYQIGRLVVMLF